MAKIKLIFSTLLLINIFSLVLSARCQGSSRDEYTHAMRFKLTTGNFKKVAAELWLEGCIFDLANGVTGYSFTKPITVYDESIIKKWTPGEIQYLLRKVNDNNIDFQVSENRLHLYVRKRQPRPQIQPTANPSFRCQYPVELDLNVFAVENGDRAVATYSGTACRLPDSKGNDYWTFKDPLTIYYRNFVNRWVEGSVFVFDPEEDIDNIEVYISSDGRKLYTRP
ncbi:hypothetical protein PPL_05032 [Heterostelium album PN500]|uniref:Uncharacterized protein n=1 Tax=Heterostelium pallidum (strain ATCC 26659 / Pp 5 / PN500) TaxID=670386 RepID=D3B988_HETP5|nr:hypothetical protein PPL_05032 [Heterostelium album PN500]EFA82127.1 hypothetical protein PPL_05032 [Heterostelium album PN500]|eukprot:XP_020434244.1 hypothetical protein PPL_05032 [Heterostelium album PN500]